MKAWHRDDIVEVLAHHGWSVGKSLPGDAYFEGERLLFARGAELLEVALVADVGSGFTGAASLEEAIGRRRGYATASLWLHRRRDTKWRHALSRWAAALTTVPEGESERPGARRQ